jgi:hypothetical protein
MKRKIVGLLILLLLLGISIPSIEAITGGLIGESHISSNTGKPLAVFVKMEGVDGESNGKKSSAGVKLTIINSGSHIMSDIDWTFDAEGGTIVFGDGINGRIPVLEPGEEATILLRPGHFILHHADGQSPIGLGFVTLMATAETSTDTAEITEDVFLIGPIIFFR